MQNQRNYTLKNGTPVIIRQPGLEDAAAYLEYLNQVFLDDSFFLTTYEESNEWRTLEKLRERIVKFQDPGQGLILIAAADKKLVGLADINCQEKSRLRHVGSIGISILSGYRGLGLGTAMMQSLIEWARNHTGLEKLILSVHSNNTVAHRLYEKLGFQEEGRRIRQMKFADGSYTDDICMARFVK